ncbi:MAG: type II toxin-antitoxin system VapC family toxin [Sphingomonas sp.]|uniref:type II toxin-antitoxin system VapC family toxin n=1 Tax=Sphingomonas sp. TaxID=28214 RepID=UPI00185DF98B|nr:type II toxin-antitoxin system VapC family toxin [Sphingomonas sp.]MBA3666918.1 type II toxin-antitoxin system VapC family toxin [Sphingomonas sp.]
MRGPPIVADTSIWIDHINNGNAELAAQLRRRRILLHPMIVGEIALGSIPNRQIVLEELKALPAAPNVSHTEVIAMVEWLELYNRGIGLVDCHLLASVKQVPDAKLWTRDKRLDAQAERLGIAYAP